MGDIDGHTDQHELSGDDAGDPEGDPLLVDTDCEEEPAVNWTIQAEHHSKGWTIHSVRIAGSSRAQNS